MIDILCFLVVPVLVWRLIRGIVPMAVMPILTGLAVAVAADRFGFDKAVFGPSRVGESIGWIGVLLLTFSAGLETRAMAHGPRMGVRTFFAAIAALALPFLLGFAAVQSGALDWALARPPGTSPLLAAMAIGLCLAVSALPVLVGIVRELPQADRLLGNMALRIAALDDAILWIGLAVLLSLHAGQTSGLMQVDWAHVGAVGAFVMLAIARGPLNRVAGAHAALALGVGTLYLVVGAWATSTLGLHELLGAYFAGALAPSAVAERFKPEMIGKVALFGLAPLFFAHRGLSIDGSVVTIAALWLALALFVAGAAMKIIAIQAVPPEREMPAPERLQLGVLLQCKGLMEIVAASILLQNGLLSPAAFSIMVTLAIISTSLTIPLFRAVSRVLVVRRGRQAQAVSDR